MPVSAGGGVRVEVRAGVQAKQPERAGGVRRPGAGRTRRTPPVPRSAGPRPRPAGPAAAAGRPARRPARQAGTDGRATASSAATRSASGSRAHSPASACDRSGIGVRPPPDQRLAAGRPHRPAAAGPGPGARAPSRATRPASESRLVTTMTQPGAAGQQRSDLLHRRRRCRQHQHPPPGQQAAVPRGALVLLGRNVLAGHAQGAQEPGQRVGRRHRPVGVVPAQVDEQLPVREVLRDPVRPVHRQRGLAHPRGPRHRRDHRRGAGVSPEPGQQPRRRGQAAAGRVRSARWPAR